MHTEQAIALRQQLIATSIFTYAREGILITDAQGSIIDVNDAFVALSGYSREEVIGKNPRMFQSGRQSSEFYAAMWLSLIQHGCWTGEIWNRRKNGEVFAEIETIIAVRDADNIVHHYVALLSDITQTRQHQAQIDQIKHYDVLTGLPNRVLLIDRLRTAIEANVRREHSLAVMLLDLDDFMEINSEYGHQVGDELLITISNRLKDSLREGDTLARIGGDEFVIILANMEQEQNCALVMERILSSISNYIHVNHVPFSITASIGVALYPLDGKNAEQLIHHASQAMHQAKGVGKNRYHYFDFNQYTAIKAQRDNLKVIQHALEKREFSLYYQPKVNLRTGEVIGTEALIRWLHPERKVILPAEFLPVIENQPISIEIGEWVIETALAQMSQWQQIGLDIAISVNIDGYQLQRPDFIDKLEQTLARYPRVKSSKLELEILESSALNIMIIAETVINACDRLGVTFALDDFGTGYSSLTHLRRLPAHVLKIDQSFVRDMLDDTNDLAIVTGVIGLAKAFNREVIAEGVETIAHGKKLLEIGCEYAQGYGIAKPMPASELPAWIKNWKSNLA